MAQENSRIHSGQEMGECPQVKEALVGEMCIRDRGRSDPSGIWAAAFPYKTGMEPIV